MVIAKVSHPIQLHSYTHFVYYSHLYVASLRLRLRIAPNVTNGGIFQLDMSLQHGMEVINTVMQQLHTIIIHRCTPLTRALHVVYI